MLQYYSGAWYIVQWYLAAVEQHRDVVELHGCIVPWCSHAAVWQCHAAVLQCYGGAWHTKNGTVVPCCSGASQ